MLLQIIIAVFAEPSFVTAVHDNEYVTNSAFHLESPSSPGPSPQIPTLRALLRVVHADQWNGRMRSQCRRLVVGGGGYSQQEDEGEERGRRTGERFVLVTVGGRHMCDCLVLNPKDVSYLVPRLAR